MKESPNLFSVISRPLNSGNLTLWTLIVFHEGLPLHLIKSPMALNAHVHVHVNYPS